MPDRGELIRKSTEKNTEKTHLDISDREEQIRRSTRKNAGKPPSRYSTTMKRIELKRLEAMKALQQKQAEIEIEKLIIDIKASMEVEKVLRNSSVPLFKNKLSRGNRFSIAERQERNKEECQRIFDLQNKVLTGSEVLSTDEGTSPDEECDEDIEEMEKNLEKILANKKVDAQLSLVKEEEERQELGIMIMEGDDKNKIKIENRKDDEDTQEQGSYGKQVVVLPMSCTFRDSVGEQNTRVETMRKPGVIDTYLEIHTSKDESFIRQFATLDEPQKEEVKREKRRIQEKLRRIKRNQEKQRLTLGQPVSLSHSEKSHTGTSVIPNTPPMPTTSAAKPPSPTSLSKSWQKTRLKPDLKLKCCACSNVGHTSTNKVCSPYKQTASGGSSMNVSLSGENVDGTKLKLSGKIVGHVEEMKKLMMKVPEEPMGSRKRRRTGNDLYCDFLKKTNKSANWRRTDPIVVLFP